ncbi:MAG: hypothetical protein AB8B85_04080, partial [Paracoccaceae bacterium]
SVQIILTTAPTVAPLYFPPHFTATPYHLGDAIASLFEQASRYFTIPDQPIVIEMGGHETHAPYEVRIEIKRPHIH